MPRRFNRRAEDAGTGSSIWLISFTDIMALMLTFFVLLFAMSNPKQEDWERVTRTVQENFRVFRSYSAFDGKIENRGAEDAITIEKINFSEALNIQYLRVVIEKLIEQSPALQVVQVIDNKNHLVLSFPQDILFESGQARLKPEANRALFTLANALQRIRNRVEIVGHTDPTPVSSAAYESNWELSLARAIAVAGAMENVGYKRPVIVRGQASGRFKDLPQTIPRQERLDLSRRVDILIMEDGGRRRKLFDIGLPSIGEGL